VGDMANPAAPDTPGPRDPRSFSRFDLK
jgi:hypothetical protein